MHLKWLARQSFPANKRPFSHDCYILGSRLVGGPGDRHAMKSRAQIPMTRSSSTAVVVAMVAWSVAAFGFSHRNLCPDRFESVGLPHMTAALSAVGAAASAAGNTVATAKAAVPVTATHS